jgi:hypothetical protein
MTGRLTAETGRGNEAQASGSEEAATGGVAGQETPTGQQPLPKDVVSDCYPASVDVACWSTRPQTARRRRWVNSRNTLEPYRTIPGFGCWTVSSANGRTSRSTSVTFDAWTTRMSSTSRAREGRWRSGPTLPVCTDTWTWTRSTPTGMRHTPDRLFPSESPPSGRRSKRGFGNPPASPPARPTPVREGRGSTTRRFVVRTRRRGTAARPSDERRS